MNRNELKTIAEGFKKARPQGDGLARVNGALTVTEQWARTVAYVADALHLEGKQRSNFLAACGAIHGQG